MELWIRSQDRKDLISTRGICMTKGDYEQIGIFANGIVIGSYKTKERALEVLDEIQEAQLENYHYRCPSNVKVSNNENTIVYEMPEQ